jgi:hypothetical protein
MNQSGYFEVTSNAKPRAMNTGHRNLSFRAGHLPASTPY